MKGPPDSFWAALPFGRGVKLVAQGAGGLAALDKPAGILSHPNAVGEEPRSLLNASYHLDGEFYEWPAPAGIAGEPSPAPLRLWLLNRLDSATSGVILVAADAALAAAIRAQFKRRQIHKVYLALVFGKPPRTTDTWKDRLAVKKKGGRIRADAGHIPSESRMSVVRSGPHLSLLRLEPQTGRSHQLRVQCADRGLPIVGDQTYGDFRRNREFARAAGTKRLFLHSFETRFEYEWAGRPVSFLAQTPLPAEFEANMVGMGGPPVR